MKKPPIGDRLFLGSCMSLDFIHRFGKSEASETSDINQQMVTTWLK